MTVRSPFSAGFTDSAAGTLAAQLAAIAEPHRLKILAPLNSHGELRVVEIVGLLKDLKQPTVSHRVGKLIRAGLVLKQKRGGSVWCALDARAVADIASALSPWSAS